jgi:hypothetical protein
MHTLLASDQLDAARTAQQRADTLLAAALAHDDTVTRWREYHDRADLLAAAIAARSGDSAQALERDYAVLSRLQPTTMAGSNTESFWILERARLQTGDDLNALGRAQEARVEWGSIVQSLADPITTYEPKLLVVLEAADSRLGRQEAARVISKYLTALSVPPAG